MCHPTASDLLLGRGNRLLSGVCLRGRLCFGRDVLDLSGRVPGGRTRRSEAGDPKTTQTGTRSGASCTEKLIPALLGASKQHKASPRVELGTSVHSEQPEGVCRTKAMMRQEQTSHPHRGCARHGQYDRSRTSAVIPCALAASKSFQQTSALPAKACVQRVAGAVPLRRCSSSTPSFRPHLQTIAGGEQIATGANRIKAKEVRNQSAIVLVTALGNVTSSLQLIPRG
jgi:hypothetical protein